MDINDIFPEFRLRSGAGGGDPKKGFCYMETVAFIAGEGVTDHPECVSPTITRFGIALKRGTLGESKESYKVKTYGRVVAITRQTLINDDLDAFTRMPGSARRLKPKSFDKRCSLAYPSAEPSHVKPQVRFLAGPAQTA